MSIRITFLFLLLSKLIFSQESLGREVTLQYTNVPVNLILREIQNQTGIVFSYSDFQDNQPMSIHVVNKSLNDVLTIIESSLNIEYTVKGKYIILKPTRDAYGKVMTISGTILDPDTEMPLADASVYVKKHKILVNSNKNGKFFLKVPPDATQVKVQVAKENYIDTSILIIASQSQNLHITLRSFPREKIPEYAPLQSTEISITPTVKESIPLSSSIIEKPTYNKSFWQKMKLKNVNLVNINDTFFNNFSISLIPPISTNKLLSFHTSNKVSINIIGGNSKELHGLEIGGIYNYDDGNVYGLQVAGGINAVSENVAGVQVAGYMNAVKGYIKGVQIAGVTNNNDSITDGVQIAGVYQKTQTIRGLQIAGVLNQDSKSSGAQISGIINKVDSASSWLQISGFYNRAHHVQGVQLAGLINVCDTLDGVQIGLFNRVNYINGGVQIGLINLVKDGYHKLEISQNELGSTTLGFRSGWAPLHLHFFGGLNLAKKDRHLIQGGMGLASSIPISKTLYFEADANVRHTRGINKNASWDFNKNHFNFQNQMMVGFSWQPFKKMGLRSGFTINHFWYNNADAVHNDYVSLIKNPLYESEGKSRSHKLWIGWQVGLLMF